MESTNLYLTQLT